MIHSFVPLRWTPGLWPISPNLLTTKSFSPPYGSRSFPRRECAALTIVSAYDLSPMDDPTVLIEDGRMMTRLALSLMKKLSLSLSLLVGFVTASLQAGEPVAYKQVAPPPPELYGLGFYGAIDMGANLYQNRGGERTFTDDFGDTLTIDPKNDVGFFGGMKLGYVFGTGVFRPTVEETS